jgi:DnaJ family protein C protein 3
MAKSLDKSFARLDELLGKEDWKGVVKLLFGTGAGGTDDLWKRYEEALLDNVGQERDILPLVPTSLLEQVTPSLVSKSKPTTFHLPLATKISPQRQVLVKALCKSYTRLADVVKSSAEYKKQMEKWCEELLTLDGRKEDIDGLVGRAEALIAKQEFGEAVRALEKAFEISGRGDRDVRILIFSAFYMWMLTPPVIDSATLGQGSKAFKAEQKQRLL